MRAKEVNGVKEERRTKKSPSILEGVAEGRGSNIKMGKEVNGEHGVKNIFLKINDGMTKKCIFAADFKSETRRGG